MLKIEGLEKEKRELQEQVYTLRNENESLSKSLRGLETVKEARDKQAEIQKLLETNMQTLEQRCELLEMQNENLKKEKE